MVATADMRQPGHGPVLQPLYREAVVSPDALAAGMEADGRAGADPFLLRHLAARLDARLLTELQDAIGGGGPLDPVGRVPRLHVGLTLPGILSDGFAETARLCRRLGAALGVEVALIDACADAAAFGRARERLAELGALLVLGSISHLALLMTRPWALRPDLMKLDWSPRLPELPGEERARVAAALDEAGPHRMVLARADTEAALRWGLSAGIRRFQGRHVDAMLGAGTAGGLPDRPGLHAAAMRRTGRGAGAGRARGLRVAPAARRRRPTMSGVTRTVAPERPPGRTIATTRWPRPGGWPPLVRECAASGIARRGLLLRLSRLPEALSRPAPSAPRRGGARSADRRRPGAGFPAARTATSSWCGAATRRRRCGQRWTRCAPLFADAGEACPTPTPW